MSRFIPKCNTLQECAARQFGIEPNLFRGFVVICKMPEDIPEVTAPSIMQLIRNEIASAPEKIAAEIKKTGSTDWIQPFETRLAAIKGLFDFGVQKGEIVGRDMAIGRANLDKLLHDVEVVSRKPKVDNSGNIKNPEDGLVVVSMNGINEAHSRFSQEKYDDIVGRTSLRKLVDVPEDKRNEFIERLDIFASPKEESLQKAA